MHGAAIPEDVRGLLADVDTFISQTLKGENLSKKAKEKKDILLKKLKDVKASYLQEFQDKGTWHLKRGVVACAAQH